MKTKIISFFAILAISFATNAQIDRSKMPKPGPDPVIKLGKAITFSLKNGLKVIMVENHKLPKATASLTIDNIPYFEGDKKGVSSIMGSLLGRGTKNITKDEFNEQVDYLGAYVDFDGNGVYASSLKRYFSDILELVADGVKNAQFSQEELEKEIKITLDGLKSEEKSVTATARRVENALSYGKNHPFGEFTTKKTVHNITLNDVISNYNTYYRPNNAYLVITGDINPKETKELVTQLFEDWKKGTIPSASLPKPQNVTTTEINFIDMPNAVQSEIAIINTIDLQLGDDDYYAALLANTILGGGGTARLFMNLREDKGYTYGSYSRISQSRYTGRFKAAAAVRNIVTDSAVVEIQKEINKIRYQQVSDEELKNAKEKYIGSFVMDVQKPKTAASFALNIARYNLPDDYYKNYISNINKVTLKEVQNAALKYFQGDKARIVITGKGIEVLKNLEKGDYIIKYFDKEGNPSEKPAMSLPIPEGTTATTVIDNYFNAIGGKDKVTAIKSISINSEAKVQGMTVNLTVKKAAPNKEALTVSVMGNTMQKNVFDGEKGYSETQGQREELTTEQIEEAKLKTAPFSDLEYKKGTLKRIEPIDGKNAYVIHFNDSEIYYDIASGFKVKSIQKIKTPDGKETRVPTLFSNYKEVKGIKFPHNIGQKMGPMDIKFEVKEIKINEGVSDNDFN